MSNINIFLESQDCPIDVLFPLEEALYQGKEVELNKPFRTPDGPKKFSVYVKNDNGNIVKVNFGDPDMDIQTDDPDRRKAFRSRHNCNDKTDKTKPGYWSCLAWSADTVAKGLGLGEHISIDNQEPITYIEDETSRKEEYMDKIQEKSLSRILQKMQDYDCGTITAYREYEDEEKTIKRSYSQNQKLNHELLASLLTRDYSVTAVEGYFLEDGADPVKERSFFVADHNNRGDLERVLIELGKYYDQDCILFIPKGGSSGFLHGTSKRESAYPSYGEVQKLGNPVFGQGGSISTYVSGRPFLFLDEKRIYPPSSFMGRMGCRAVANKVLKVD